jgi:hypothetical protein
MEKKRIGDLLKEEGIISDREIGLALLEQRATRERVGDILLRLGLVTQTELAQAIAKQFGIEFIELRHFTPQRDALSALPVQFARDNSVLPIGVEDGTLSIATSEPDNSKLIDLARASPRSASGAWQPRPRRSRSTSRRTTTSWSTPSTRR